MKRFILLSLFISAPLAVLALGAILGFLPAWEALEVGTLFFTGYMLVFY